MLRPLMGTPTNGPTFQMQVVPLHREPVNYVDINSGKLHVGNEACSTEVQLSTVVDENFDPVTDVLSSQLSWRDHSVPEDTAWTAQKHLRVGPGQGLHVMVRQAQRPCFSIVKT